MLTELNGAEAMTAQEFRETAVSCFWLTEKQADEWLTMHPADSYTQEDIEKAHQYFQRQRVGLWKQPGENGGMKLSEDWHSWRSEARGRNRIPKDGNDHA